MGGSWSTHEVRLGAHEVSKRFRDGAGEAPAREWTALRLLHAYAPGLAPEPLGADLGATRPVIRMSRLPGTPLRGGTVTPERTRALAAAVHALHRALPPEAARALPPRAGGPHGAAEAVRRFDAARSPAASRVACALDRGMAWLRTGAPGEDPYGPPVLGAGDGNLANYLWDGKRVRVVDFEESGRSDRVFELAEITEHVGAWTDSRFDTAGFLACCELTRAERSRLLECRRLLALVWLFLLSYELPHGDADGTCEDAAGRTPPRNPPGTAGRQAERLQELLDATRGA